MNILIKTLLFAVLLSASYAKADNHDTAKALECKPLAVVLAQLDAVKAKGFAVLEDEDLARAVQFARGFDEQLNRRWTVAIVAILADDSLVLMLGNDGKLCVGMKVAAEVAPGLLKIIFGLPV